jgi:hypothetical protein
LRRPGQRSILHNAFGTLRGRPKSEFPCK